MKKSMLPFLMAFGLLLPVVATAQGERQLVPTLATETIQVDGHLLEAAWQQAPQAGDFWQVYPVDTVKVANQTAVWVAYDAKHLYIAAKLYDVTSRQVIQTLKRDTEYWNSDAFSVILDPLHKRMGGYIFGVNAAGAQYDGLLDEITGDDSPDWDTKWYSAVSTDHDVLTVEIAIPLNVLRFNRNEKTWGINFVRTDMTRNTFSVWNRVPNQYTFVTPAYAGELYWPTAPQSTRNLVVLPYAKSSAMRDATAGEPGLLRADAGVDLKMRVGPSLNLDLTVNPDFSQVEVDQQVTNLDRFDPTFPERRGFFLENSDVFSGFGIWPAQPFNSRTIGLKDGKQLPILLGTKLSGNLTENLRIGLFNIQTRRHAQEKAQNYTVAVFRRRLFKRSNLSGMLTNRQGMGDGFTPEKSSYNRTYGLEFNYHSEDGKWVGLAQHHQSLLPGKPADRQYYALSLQRNGKNLQAITHWSRVGQNFNPGSGLTPRHQVYDLLQDTVHRIGFYQLWGSYSYTLYPKQGNRVLRHRLELQPTVYFGLERVQQQDGTYNLNYTASMANRAQLEGGIRYVTVQLPFVFQVPGAKEPLPATQYRFSRVRAAYQSDPRKAFSWSARVENGGFYSGSIQSYGGSLKYRVQPWGTFSVDVTQHFIQLPEAYGSSRLTLISPRAEVSFRQNLFWTTFLQYNTQQQNFNVNSRLQWRFKPMSDVYLVYTDNYTTMDLGALNRGLVLKVNYWLNL
ncbi:MAG: carbohydrate binding family 9 domain-containing protein [Hymenobacteraceae bacterium]|nr:carbohydrate binding family 9 domain-containing protein [Hymenobacteraceae bacterium]